MLCKIGASKKRIIGEYSYLTSGILGQGYSGRVYLGKHQITDILGQRCAIKIIEKSILKFQAHKSMILCEIEFLTNLKNKNNILSLLDVYTTKNNIYQILELCNTDLEAYLNIRKKIPELQAIQILKNIIVGFKEMVQANIIHRDLKPSNILIKGDDIKIADFGLSMYLNQKEEYANINVGSPLYMPAEVLAFNQYSFQSDIWAIGIIFYEMLEGKVPWTATTEQGLLEQIHNFDILSIMPTEISKSSQDFLHRALTKQVDKRMTSAQMISFTFNFENILNNISLDESKFLEEGQQIRNTLKTTKISFINPVGDQKELQSPLRKKKQKQSKFQVRTNKKQKQEIETEIDLLHKAGTQNLGKVRMKTKQDFDKVKVKNQSPALQKQTEQIFQTTHMQYSQLSNQKKTKIKIKIKHPQIKERISDENKKTEENTQYIQQKIKDFSKLLRCQIHYCRFICKLLQRMISTFDNQKKLITVQLKDQMIAIIFQKLNRILTQKLKDSQAQRQWQISKQWYKIKNVVSQYMSQYKKKLLKEKDIPLYNSKLMKKQLRKCIFRLYKRAYLAFMAEEALQEKASQEIKANQKLNNPLDEQMLEQPNPSQIMKFKNQIIILDYLITFKQLMRVEERLDWEGFERKVNMENIINEQPLQYVQQKDILALSDKIEKLKIL